MVNRIIVLLFILLGSLIMWNPKALIIGFQMSGKGSQTLAQVRQKLTKLIVSFFSPCFLIFLLNLDSFQPGWPLWSRQAGSCLPDSQWFLPGPSGFLHTVETPPHSGICLSHSGFCKALLREEGSSLPSHKDSFSGFRPALRSLMEEMNR